MDRQCSSCGGFCKKSGCERENVKPKREWQGLTDEEVKHQWEVWRANSPRYMGFAAGIEAILKERNT